MKEHDEYSLSHTKTQNSISDNVFSLNLLTSCAKSSAYSKSSSCNVSMWSDVNAIGTKSKFFLPNLANDLITSSVCGLNQGNGPTYNYMSQIP